MPAHLPSPAERPVDSWGRRQGPQRGRWELRLYATRLELVHPSGTLRLDGTDTGRLSVRRRWLRGPVLVVNPAGGADTRPLRLTGLRRSDASRLDQAVEFLRLRSRAGTALGAVTSWYDHVHHVLADAGSRRRWITVETVAALTAAKPPAAPVLQHLMVRPLWGLLSDDERAALQFTGDDVHALVDEANERIVADSLATHRKFFDTIESSPLTPEQARAVVTFDNRVHLIAAAGSGKTSVMVARAAYAVHRGFVPPDRILLLAFNKDAADELQERVTDRFAAAGLDADGIRATTFHAFGLGVIGAAVGQKPSVAPWVADGRDTTTIADIVADLREHDPGFALSWDLFRLLYARVTDDLTDTVPADAWDKATRTAGLATFGGDVVRSQGERLIADWLYLNHVDYEYERPYVHGTADATHRQYQPDFYYPATGTWHEHWGVDRNGNPPPSWTGYRAEMAWKKDLHARHGTDLIETTWSGIMDRSDFHRLADELHRRGIERRWDPQRPSRGAAPVKDADVIRLIRTFLTHVKSNALTRVDIESRVAGGRVHNSDRANLFLSVYWPVHDAWQARLAAGGYVDFEDMLTQAAGHLETGLTDPGYDLVLVDELQDASRARAAMVRALVAKPGRHLLAVGDDWQSVNRFAGADLSVLSSFRDFFGPGPDLYLTTTFRCHQSITQAATRFISKNPGQLTKTVTSVRPGLPDPDAHEGLTLRQVPDAAGVASVVAEFLDDLAAQVQAGRVRPVTGATVAVDVLGRYRHDRQLMPARTQRPGLTVTFRTVHGAKGLEADYVVVPNLGSGTYGFPSQITDDPVLNLAMTERDAYEHAEERRLFYVALTRARRGVLLVAPAGTPSLFVTELVRDELVRVVGDLDDPVACPVCGAGVLRPRHGPHGEFWGCSAFPACRYTVNDLPQP